MTSHNIPQSILAKWQDMVELLARLVGVPAASIRRIVGGDIEVLVATREIDGSYRVGERAGLSGSGIYCEAVLQRRAELMVADADLDAAWKGGPEAQLGIKSYLGVPLMFPGGELFGTLCVIDRRAHEFSETQRQLVAHCRDTIEAHLESIQATAQLTEHMAHARRMRSDLLAMVGHDIRTPLNGILGMSELLMQTVLDDDQKAMGRSIRYSADILLTTVEHFVDASKLEAGTFQLAPTSFSLRTLIEETRAALAPAARKKKLLLACDVDPVLGGELWGDPGCVRHVLVTLIAAAIEFASEGSVIVTARHTRRSAERTAFRVAVGLAVPAALEPMTWFTGISTPGASAAESGGSSLSQTICRRLLALMGGEIGFDSVPGRGAECWFALELSHPPTDGVSSTPGTSVAAPPDRLLRLLIVDDNEINRSVALRMLTALGHRAELAGNGKEALARLARESYDAVLMDCQMPGLDGYEATRRIRSGAVAAIDTRVPIIALTAYATAADRQRCLDAGMNDYVSKPMRTDDLRAALQRLVSPGVASSSPVEVAGQMPSSADALDDATLEGLRKMSGSGPECILAQCVALFVRTAPADLATLGELIAAKRGDEAGLVAHALAGSCATLGAREMRQLALTMETAATAGSWSETTPLLAELIEAHARVRLAFVARKLIANP